MPATGELIKDAKCTVKFGEWTVFDVYEVLKAAGIFMSSITNGEHYYTLMIEKEKSTPEAIDKRQII